MNPVGNEVRQIGVKVHGCKEMYRYLAFGLLPFCSLYRWLLRRAGDSSKMRMLDISALTTPKR